MQMNIRYVCSDEERKTDSTLSAVAERAATAGIVLAGTVQPANPDASSGKCDIVLGLLPDGEKRNISFDLAPGVTGCRLNADALEAAVMVVHERLSGAQALVVNKFSKQEAVGRGLVAAIGEACDRGLPVLVGVPPEWREAFLNFTEGKAQPLPANEEAILEWLRTACLGKVA